MTPLYPQKLALTSPTGDGRSVGIVRWRTKATEFSLVWLFMVNVIQVGKKISFSVITGFMILTADFVVCERH